MALADTAKLVVDLSLKGNFAAQIKASDRALAGFGSRITNVQGRAYKAGQQIGVGIQRTAILGVAAVGALVPLLVSIAKEGQEAARVETIFTKAVSNSGKVSLANVAALRAQEAALLKLGGVDDELIKTEQTRLVQMGLTGDEILKLTPLILDFSKATGIDLLTATKLAGKATQGNIGALSRYGVQIDKAKASVDPFAATVDALNHKFGGTTKALSGSLGNKLAVFREELANVREEAGIRLLPVMTRLVDIVGSRIVPAFGKFLDRILPRAIAGLNKLGDALESGAGAQTVTRIVDTIQALLPAIESGARITGTIISTAVHLFESLPPEIQGLAVAGLAVNKLTGGLVTNLAGGLISSVLKQLVSGVVNVNGGVVNVNGAAGVGGAIGGTVGGGLGLLPAATIAGAIVLAAVPIGQAFASALPSWLKGPGGEGKSQSQLAHEAADAAVAAAVAAQGKSAAMQVHAIDRMEAILAQRVVDNTVRTVAASERAEARLGSAASRQLTATQHAGSMAARKADALHRAQLASTLAVRRTEAAENRVSIAVRVAKERIAAASLAAGRNTAAAIKAKKTLIQITTPATVVNNYISGRTVATSIRKSSRFGVQVD